MTTNEQFSILQRGRRSKRPTAERTGAVIYCRVSAKPQLGNFSMASQRKVCRDFCANKEVDDGIWLVSFNEL
jgi:hypothetical protein